MRTGRAMALRVRVMRELSAQKEGVGLSCYAAALEELPGLTCYTWGWERRCVEGACRVRGGSLEMKWGGPVSMRLLGRKREQTKPYTQNLTSYNPSFARGTAGRGVQGGVPQEVLQVSLVAVKYVQHATESIPCAFTPRQYN